MSDKPLPPYVFKIAPSAPPSPLPETLPLSELDATDGFIHLSDAAQIPKTADLFFKDTSSVWLLKVRTAPALAAGGVFKWVAELPGCVHLHGPRDGEWVHLGKENIADVREARKEEGQSWGEAMKGLQEEGWLADA
ncbi:hypothetical protein CERSUDRAFT_112081 [Gelatoporia subvermispora B]|uniref:DUF952 domain-containing protein n=1 Tax=Ceriporiopsis subvermispora (strain B) TaxID=914234 RepID=M2QRV2_CERS8|nr:hypothetical protein CERSUDRAFT_112081 [Gelatoporia subvermispora B]